MVEYLITTYDNPHDQLKEPGKWADFDHIKGYFSYEKVARLANTSNKLSEEENQELINDAIDRLVKMHGGKIYKKIKMNK